MRKITVAAAAVLCVGVAVAAPVKTKISYTNVQALSSKFSNKLCNKVFASGVYSFDSSNPVNIKASKYHTIKNSNTVLSTTDKNGDKIYIKLGKSVIKMSKGKYVATRVSYVVIDPKTGDASGKTVIVGACSANFTSVKATK